MLHGTAHRVSVICHDLRFIVRKEFPSEETTQKGVHGARDIVCAESSGSLVREWR